MDHYTQISHRLDELKSYPNPTKEQLIEIVSILEGIIEWVWPKVVAVPFTIEDCEDLRDGWSFLWEFDWVTLDIFNCDTDPRDEDEDYEDPFAP